MTSVEVPAGETGTPLFTLDVEHVSTVTFVDNLASVEVISDGTADLWWTCDGSDPANQRGHYIPAALSVDQRRPSRRRPAPSHPHGTVVRLWSTGAPIIRVQRG